MSVKIDEKTCERGGRMKIIITRMGEGQLFVIARNQKTAIKEMKSDLPDYKFVECVTIANNNKGELGQYYFKRGIK